MTDVGEAFRERFGEPDQPAETGIEFPTTGAQRLWKKLQNEVVPGWYLNGFVYLFGAELKQLKPCLDSWSFLFDENRDRIVVGKNAYGSLLVMEQSDVEGIAASVGLIDTWRVTYWQPEQLGFINLIGRWLPDDMIPHFLDTHLYDAWHETTNDTLGFSEILGIEVPLPLGGEVRADNFQVEDILEYYQTTGPIYQKLFDS